MGITIWWHFQPENFDPTRNPAEAHRRIDYAVAAATAELERLGIPFHLPDRHVTGSEFHQAINPLGPAEGAEPLCLGWEFWKGQWTGDAFAKTQYAADFYHAHVAYCHALLKLAELGLVTDIGDEGQYCPDRSLEQLMMANSRSLAGLGALGDFLSNLGVNHAAPTPGGGRYTHQGNPDEADDTATAMRKLVRAADNIKAAYGEQSALPGL